MQVEVGNDFELFEINLSEKKTRLKLVIRNKEEKWKIQGYV